MRRMLGAVVTAVLVGGVVPGTAGAQGVTLGGKFGANFAKADINDDQGERTRRGIVLGGVLGIPLHEAFGIQLEALYAQKGLAAEDSPDERAVLKINYIDVPVLAHVRIPNRSGPVRPVFYAGPVISFEVACSIEFEEGGISGEAGCRDEDFGVDQFISAAVDFGLTGGGGFDVDLGKTILSFEARYTHGFTDILEEDATEIKNRVISAMVGLSFRVP